jgi:hypothetical protein
MSIPRRLWSLRRDRPLFVALSALTIGTLLVWLAVEFYLPAATSDTRGISLGYGFNDFSAYTGALDGWVGGGPLYTEQPEGGYHGEYLYPPITVLVFYPFATLGFTTGAVLFGALSVVLLWLGIEAVSRVLGYRLRLWERLATLRALFSFQPVIRNFRWAQTATLLAAALCFAFYFQERAEATTSLSGDGEVSERTRAAYKYASGAFTTLGSAFKLFVATSGAHLLRDRKRFVGAMVTAGALAVASVAVFGVDTHQTYIDVLTWGKGWGDTRPPYLWDRYAAYRPLHVFGSAGLYLKAAGILAVVGLTWATRSTDSVSARHSTFALGVAVVPLVAPQADSHDLVLMLLPAVIMVAHELDRPDGYAWVPVLSVLLFHLHRYGLELVIVPPEWLPAAQFIRDNAAWFQPGMWASFMLVGLIAVRVGEHAAVPPTGRAARERLTSRFSD